MNLVEQYGSLLSQEVLLEFVSNEILWLRDYLTMSARDKGAELARTFPHAFMEWFIYEGEAPWTEIASGGGTIDQDEEPWESVDALDEAGFDFSDFYAREGDALSAEYGSEAPTFLFMDFERVIKNDWLIHFTDDAYGVANYGFKYGVEDISKLGLTTYLGKGMKSGAGYNFAFTSENYRQGRGGRHGGWKYGDEAVMFRASGIMVYHFGDQEHQVIFWGPSARDLVYLYKHEDGWAVGSNKKGEQVFPRPGNEDAGADLDDVIGWVKDNFRQYRKVLSSR